MSQYKPYPAYKDSGAKWLGKVPVHWQVLPCRSVVDEKTQKNDDARIQEYLSLMANIGVIPYEEKGDVGNKKPEDLSKCKVVSRGNLVINSMNYGIGSFGLSGYNGVCSPVYIVLQPKCSVVEERFALRIFENKEFQRHAQSFGTGILEHRAAIGWDDLKGIHVGIPPLTEQLTILSVLDRETARIDALIEKKTRFIELLREKRQALITHAVTKGLNPNAKMKDSGVEWLGEVPEHWGISPLKWMASCSSGDAISIADIRAESDDGHITPVIGGNGVMGYTKRSNVNQTLLAIGRVGALCGNVHIVSPPAWITDNALRLRYDANQCHLDFLAFALEVRNLNSIASKSAQPLITGTLIGDQVIPCPPADEQCRIANHCRVEIVRIDSLQDKTKRSIELLKERRSALITAAVTGQIDLREAS